MSTQTLKTIAISTLQIEGGTQVRAELDLNVVDDYANAKEDGDLFPEPIAFFDGSKYWLADGFHRVFAAKNTGDKTIIIEYRMGTRDDALWYAASANKKHGQPMRNVDKRNAVRLLLDTPKFAALSDSEIARHVGVSHPFVGEIRNPSIREAREKKSAVKKARATGVMVSDGVVATSPDRSVRNPSLPVTVTATQGEPSYDPSTEEGDPTTILTDEIERLKHQLAVHASDLPEEERNALAQENLEIRAELRSVRAENHAIATQRDEYMRECAELKKTCSGLQKRLETAKKK